MYKEQTGRTFSTSDGLPQSELEVSTLPKYQCKRAFCSQHLGSFDRQRDVASRNVADRQTRRNLIPDYFPWFLCKPYLKYPLIYCHNVLTGYRSNARFTFTSRSTRTGVSFLMELSLMAPSSVLDRYFLPKIWRKKLWHWSLMPATLRWLA